MKTLFLLVGMVLILEGIPYIAFPEAMRDWLCKLSDMKAEQLRMIGLLSMGVGLLVCWFVQRSGYF